MTRFARVLVADGDLQLLNAVSERLRSRGFVNLLEMTAAQAGARAKAERPDVLILGLHFPDGGTAALVDELRADPATRHIPILVLMGSGNTPDWSDAFASQIDGYLTAPICDDQLFSQLSVALRLNTMRVELLRREDTTTQLGAQGGDALVNGWQRDEPRVLLLAPEAIPVEPVKAALEGIAELQVEHSATEAAKLLGRREADVLVIESSSNADAARDACEDLRRTPTLFHLPILVVCGPADSASSLYEAGASAVVRAPFDKNDLRARMITMVRQAQLRGKMLEAYRTPIHTKVNDPGTGLFSEAFLRKHLDGLVEDSFRWDKSLSVIVIDVPEAVRVRETFGDAAGDALLTQVGSIVSHLVRGEDLCARLSESHLCVVLPDSGIEASAFATRRISGVITYTEFALSEVAPPVAVRPRLGSTEFKPGDTAQDLLDRAEAATYALAAA